MLCCPLPISPGSTGVMLFPCLQNLAPEVLCCPLPLSPGFQGLVLPPASITWPQRSYAAPCLNHLALEVLCCPLPQAGIMLYPCLQSLAPEVLCGHPASITWLLWYCAGFCLQRLAPGPPAVVTDKAGSKVSTLQQGKQWTQFFLRTALHTAQLATSRVSRNVHSGTHLTCRKGHKIV